MPTPNEIIKAQKQKFEQQNRRKRAQEKNDKEAQRKVDAHRNYIIGEIVTKRYPMALEFQPQKTKK